MNIENFKHLFVSVEERLPELGITCCCIYKLLANKDIGVFSRCSNGWSDWNGYFILDEDDDETGMEITHWLDLSILTTKERAVKLAKNAFGSGIMYYQGDEYSPGMNDFINQNKDSL